MTDDKSTASAKLSGMQDMRRIAYEKMQSCLSEAALYRPPSPSVDEQLAVVHEAGAAVASEIVAAIDEAMVEFKSVAGI